MIRETIHCFFITEEGEKQVEDYFFFNYYYFPKSDFPKEMRPITLAVCGGGGQTVTLLGNNLCAICHMFLVKAGSIQPRCEDGSRQGFIFSPLQLKICGIKSEVMEHNWAYIIQTYIYI